MPRKRNTKMNGITPEETEQIPLDAISVTNNDHPPQELPTKKTLRQGLKEIYYEFCSNTSLHGIQYFGQQRPWKEMIFWIFVFIVSIYFSTKTIDSVYQKWQDTPVIVSFAERSTPIASIPFPAITICTDSKRDIDQNDLQYGELVNNLDQGQGLPSNLTSEKLDEFLTLLQICPIQPRDYTYFNNSTPKPMVADYIKILNEISIQIRSLFASCSWDGVRNVSICDDLFTTTYTEDGLCFTFNGFNGTDLYRENTVQYRIMGLESRTDMTTIKLNRTLSWSLDKGYAQGTPLKTYPARVVSASSKASLTVYLMVVETMLDYACSGPIQGFKIVLHTPDDVPLMSKRFVRLSPGKEISIAVKPIMVTTSEGVADYKPEKRKCYMAGERELIYFKVYSEKNCELECLTNFTLKRCDCVKFSMPRTPEMPVCGADNIECYSSAEEYLLLENFHDADDDKDGCNCMPSCTSLEYDTEISQADYDAKRAFEAINGRVENWLIFSGLTIYFKDNEFITSKRSVLFGFSEFLANCGGVLGLFMGFSFLSLVELWYHLTLRLWSNMKSKRDIK